MPFTDSPSHRAPVPSQSERAISAVLADAGSHDARSHHADAIKHPCPECPALIHDRCRNLLHPLHYARDFHPARVALAAAAAVSA